MPVDDEELPRQPVSAEDATDDSPSKTGRRRRKRRRGRRSSGSPVSGERSAVDNGSDTEDASTVSELDSADLEETALPEGEGTGIAENRPAEDGEERPRKRRRRRGSGRDKAEGTQRRPRPNGKVASERPSPPVDADEDDAEPLDADAQDDGGDDMKDEKSSHRSITSWDETIGFIVSVNMEARARNPNSNSSSRGRGRGGGRGRG